MKCLKEDPEKKRSICFRKKDLFIGLNYDMLYVEILKNLVFNFKSSKRVSKLQFVDDHKRKGSKINTPEIEINFRANRNLKWIFLDF